MGPRNRLAVLDAALAAITYIGNFFIILIKEVGAIRMNDPPAPNSGIAASLGQAPGYPAENYHRPPSGGELTPRPPKAG
jgi:hypothetical protein